MISLVRSLLARVFLTLSALIITATECAVQKQLQYIIVHGTAAAEYDWYRKGGHFFKEVEESAKLFEQAHNVQVKVLGFSWSGGLLPSAREEGAINLANLIENFDPETEIRVIAHSHGTNVAHRASQIIAEHKSPHKIAILYGLGTPIDLEKYAPNMNVIGYIYNLFSFYDPAQTVWGSCDREYPAHYDRVVNMRVVVNKVHADHFNIHDPIIGLWLPFLHDRIYKPAKNNKPFPFSSPIVIYFESMDHTPKYEVDHYRNAWREMDHDFEQQYWRYYVRKAFGNAPKLIINPLQWTPKAFKDFVSYHYRRAAIWINKKLYKQRLNAQERLERINQKLLQLITGEAIAGASE